MNKDDRKILKEQADRLQEYMDDLPCDLSDEESEVQNIIDEIEGLYLSTLYKLKFLA